MQTLIIHPEDKSTDFLCPIYESLNNKTVVRGGVSKKELHELVSAHERILMIGHGSPMGLFAVGQFEDEGFMSHIVDHSFVTALQKKDNVFIWCHANQFVQEHRLTGFYSGMFISEVMEAAMYEFDVSQKTINQSNNSFSQIASKYIAENSAIIHRHVTDEYGALSEHNPSIKFNNKRLYQSALSN